MSQVKLNVRLIGSYFTIAAIIAFIGIVFLCLLYNVDSSNIAEVNMYLRISGVLLLIGIIAAILIGFRISHAVSGPIQNSLYEVSETIQKVSSGSAQVFSAAQQLADGSTSQASSLEETSSSLEELSSMTKQNADNANQARAMMQEAGQIVEKVNRHMDDMAKAITEITKSSEETGKIIKTIDEIAFQTNLLALNAAVEAARAGEAGAGFAVVADEVRNLAMRSAEAAKNTSELIENTIKAVKNGNDLTKATQEAFKDNIASSTKIGQLVDEIATASQEQAHGISQINRAVAEMDKVVQQAAYNAESSANASETMNSQVNQLKTHIDELMEVFGTNTSISRQTKLTSEIKTTNKLSDKKIVEGRKMISAPGQKRDVRKREMAPPVRTKAIRPEQVIPFGKEDFKDF